jgi:hypothetical protein
VMHKGVTSMVGETDTNLCVMMVLQGCYDGVARVLQGCYKGVTSVLQECSRVSQEC